MQTETVRPRSSRVRSSLVAWSTLAFAASFAAGCSSAESGSPAAPVTSATTSTESSATTPSSAAREAGSVRGDVGAIEVFDDPASQIRTNAELTDYLLPGMSGEGVDCARDGFDPAVILEMPIGEGSNSVAGIILDCVDRDDVGSIVAMYAVGFQADGAELFPEVGPCAAAAFASDSTKALRDGLESIYLARLDLPSPPTSPDIARDLLAKNSDCLDPSPTPASVPSTTTERSVPQESTSAPANSRSIKWNLLAPGDCLAAIPQGDFTTVAVINCDVPHATEVVGASFLTSAEAENGCRSLFKNYTGQEIESAPWVIDILEAASPGGSLRVICLASSTDGQPTTGSLRAG